MDAITYMETGSARDSATHPPRRLRGGWYARRDETSYVLSRQWPPRFDVCASSVFPPVGRARLAQQIRQDLWRKLRGLRGFSPVILIEAKRDELIVHAGGRLAGPTPNGLDLRIRELLDSPGHRARWVSWAAKGAQ